MKHMGKTWMTIALCVAALTLGACGKEESGNSQGAQGSSEIQIGQSSGGQTGSNSLSENPASDFEYKEENGKITITKYIGESKEVVIPSQIEGKDVTTLGFNCFYGQDITRVVCPNTLENIGSDAFGYCSELREIELNEGLQEIRENAFLYCSSLESICIPSTVVFVDDLGFAGSGIKELEFLCGSAEEWGAGIFNEICVEELTIPSALKIVPEGMFARAESLERVIIEDGIERIDRQAFGYCGKLKEVIIPASVVEIEAQVFEYTSSELVLAVEQGSYAESYAKENGIDYVDASSASFILEKSQAGMEDSIMKEGLTERIKKVEEYCHVKFPDSYIKFIEEYNVGLPEANTFTANDTNYVIERFLGFVNDYQNSPLGEYDIAVVLSQIDTYLTDNPNLIGDELIPIARLTTDDYVCLNFKENKEEPSVCIWSSAESEEFHPVIYEVADSFLYFVEELE